MRRIAAVVAAATALGGLGLATFAAMSGVAMVSAGPGVAAGPAPGPTRDPATFPPARGPACADDPEAAAGPDPSAAAGEIQDLGWDASDPYYGSYTGLAMSGPGIAVYRYPDPALDGQIERIAARYGVCVDILDAPVSRRTMDRLSAEVHRRKARLSAAGARLTSIATQHTGRLAVRVAGDVPAARSVLADLGRHVVVDPGSPSVPV